MAEPISIRALRKELGLTLDQFADRVGVTSKGHMSDIERAGSCSISVALNIEKLAGGRIPARTLNADIARIQDSRPAEPQAAAA